MKWCFIYYGTVIFLCQGVSMPDIIALAHEAGFDHVGKIKPSALVARNEVRDMCAAGRCGVFGRSWSCPPGCGSIEHCQKRMSAYSGGLLLQTTGYMDDEFDLDTIAATQIKHKKQFATLVRQLRTIDPALLPLTAGCCTLCRKCTYPSRPCRFPGKMLSSMEAYGLLVSEVCQQSGLGYYYGPKTITYTSCVLTNNNI